MGKYRFLPLFQKVKISKGFFGPRTPVDNLEASVVALDHFLKIKEQLSNVVIVSPDAGGVARSV